MNDATLRRVVAALSKTVLFRGVRSNHLVGIARLMTLQNIKKGEALVQTNALSQSLYVVDKGKLSIFRQQADAGASAEAKNGRNISPSSIVKEGSVVGELSMLYNLPSTETIVAATAARLWTLGRVAFKAANMRIAEDRQRQFGSFLNGVSLLQNLTDTERSLVAETLVEEEYKRNENIMERGDEGDCMYFLKQGQVVVHKPDDKGRRRTVKHYSPGDYFGERALLKSSPRAATVVAMSDDVSVLRLDRRVMNYLLGPLVKLMEERMKRNYSEDKEAAAMQELKGKARTPQLARISQVKVTKFNLTPLRLVRFLGKGAFGRVQLCIDEQDQAYAIKAVEKKKAVKRKQEKNLNSERKLMISLSHPFVVTLYGTNKDRSFLYFVLESMPGGDMFKLMKKQHNRRFTQDQCRYYAAAIASVFIYLHQNNIVHRDLKPENVLLDYKGYPKLTDFGFAKVIQKKTYTFLGTPDYMAPEIIRSKGYGKGVDWWTLGILIFEMISGAGKTPFFSGRDRMKLYAKILDGKFRCPSHMSEEARGIVTALLCQRPHERIGMGVNGSQNLQAHPFFKPLNFQDLLDGRIPSPIEVMDRVEKRPNRPVEPIEKPWRNFEPYQSTAWDAGF